jgi:hypothetical protein
MTTRDEMDALAASMTAQSQQLRPTEGPTMDDYRGCQVTVVGQAARWYTAEIRWPNGLPMIDLGDMDRDNLIARVRRAIDVQMADHLAR